MNKRKTDNINNTNNPNDDETIRYLIASRNEMVKALKKVLDQMKLRDNKDTVNK